MVYAMNGTTVLNSRKLVTSPGSGLQHWGAQFFGPRYATTETSSAPQSLMTDMSPNETILPHFHGTTQFQVFTAGAGKMGRHDVQPLVVQFKDHHTAYGPVVAGPQGLRFFAMRMHTANSGPVYLDKPGYREKLKPSQRRNLISPPVVLSTDLVLETRKDIAWDRVYPEQYADGMDAHILRLGAGMRAAGPDPRIAGGVYLFVVNGSMDREEEELPLWSMVAIETNEEPLEIRAGAKGLEVLVLQFPREEESAAAA